MKVLAIDPGYDRCGVAVMEKNRSSLTLHLSLCITTKKKDPLETRIASIYDTLRDIIHKERPDAIAFERLFFSKNTTTALHVAECVGVIRLLCHQHHLPLAEYAPNTVKVAVTGNGSATKEDVARMVGRLVSLPKKEKTLDDEMDAIAIAITHLETGSFPHERGLAR